MLSVTRFEREANTTNNLQYGKRLIGGDQSFFLPASGQPVTRICQSRNPATVFCWVFLGLFWVRFEFLLIRLVLKELSFEIEMGKQKHPICSEPYKLEWIKPSWSKEWTFKRSQAIELHTAWYSNLTGWNDLKLLVWLKRGDPNEDVFQSEQESV